MAKAILNGQEIFGNVHLGEGGSASPTFSETVLCDNSSKASTFTLSDSMSNYDIIVFKTHNAGIDLYCEFITTPTLISQMFTLTNNGIMFNEPDSNQYCDYKVNGNTFTRYGQRNVDVVEVRGLNCTNKTVTETVIYLAPSLNSTSGVSVSGTGLLDYDYIFFSGNADAWDDTAIYPTPAQPKSCFGVETICVMTTSYYYIARTYIRDTEIWGGRPLRITGIKFT